MYRRKEGQTDRPRDKRGAFSTWVKQVERTSDYKCILARTCIPLLSTFICSLYHYYLKVAQIRMFSCFRPLSILILVRNGSFARFQLVRERLTDEWMDTPIQRYENSTSQIRYRNIVIWITATTTTTMTAILDYPIQLYIQGFHSNFSRTCRASELHFSSNWSWSNIFYLLQKLEDKGSSG